MNTLKGEVQTLEPKNEVKVTKKSELNFSEKDKSLYDEKLNELKKSYGEVEHNFLQIAFALYPIYKKELYKIDGYKNIYDFAKDKFNISRGTCSEFIRICEKFCTKTKDSCICDLKKDYKEYSLSKLRILTVVDKKFHKDFSPSMTVREMKQKRKEIENPLLNSSNHIVKENVSGEVELTIPEIFDRKFDSYDELMSSQKDILSAWKNIKEKKPEAKLKFVIEGIKI